MKARHLPVVLVLCLLSLAGGEAQAQSTPLYAIHVGFNAPPANDESLGPLQYADDDAVRFHQLTTRAGAESTLLARLDANTTRRYRELSAQPPTRGALLAAFGRVVSAVRRDVAAGRSPSVFISYSGHGSIHGSEPALTLADGGWPRSELLEQLRDLAPARVHLFVDACHAASIVGMRGAFDQELETQRVQLDAQEVAELWGAHSVEALDHVGTVVAAAGNQQAHEWSRIEAGVFTHEVLSALLGAADVNGDLAIDYSELMAFITAANRSMRDPRAHLRVEVQPPGGEYRTTLLSLQSLRDVRWLHGTARSLPHFFIELSDGSRLLDAHLGGPMRFALALPKSRAAFVVSGDREAYVGRGMPSSIAMDKLHFEQRATRARGGIAHSLSEDWFASPYSPAYYQGFVDSREIVGVPFHKPVPLPRADAGSAKPVSRRVRAGVWSSAAATLAISAASALTGYKAERQRQQGLRDGSLVERRDLTLRTRIRRSRNVALASGALTLGLAAVGLGWELRLPRKRSLALTPQSLRLRF